MMDLDVAVATVARPFDNVTIVIGEHFGEQMEISGGEFAVGGL